RTIGTSAIRVGNVGNLLSDTFTVQYTPTGTATEVLGAMVPMVDTSQTAQPSGGASPFRFASTVFALTPPVTGGLLLQITSADGPGFGWEQIFPETQNRWATTGGGYSFREFLVAVSLTSLQTYLPLNRADWTIAIVGYNIGSEWADSGSSITGDQS